MKLYFKYISMLLKCQLQYKASFIMTMVGQFLMSFTTFLAVYFMFTRINSVSGFTFSEDCSVYRIDGILNYRMLQSGFDLFPVPDKKRQSDRYCAPEDRYSVLYQTLIFPG